jgi:hypothetical protein
MKQIFNSEFNLISFFTKTEFDSSFKYFLRKESNAKTVITNNISLFDKYELLNFEIVKNVYDINDIFLCLKNIKDEIIILDYYLSLIQKLKLRKFFSKLRTITYNQNIKIVFINQAYHSINSSSINSSSIGSVEIMYVMDKIMIYNDDLINIFKSRYDDDDKTINIKKHNNYIRRKKLKNIL